MTTVLFVQGAHTRMQSWWWSKMERPLEFVGLGSAVVDLPSCQPGGEHASLADDVAAGAAALDQRLRAGDPVLLLGHSYGGMVITAAGDHELVARLVYLAAPVPEAGDTMARLYASEPAPWSDPAPSDDGTVGVLADQISEHFLQDCDPGIVPGAMARLARQSARVFGEAPAPIAWKTRPAHYLVCAQDRAVAPELQRRFADRLGEPPIELPTGHFPFLSQPAVLAAVLAQLDARGDAAAGA